MYVLVHIKLSLAIVSNWVLIIDCCSLENLKSLLHESTLMKKFNHNNVLNILGVGLDADTRLPFILLPFMADGDLKTYLRNKQSTTDWFPKVIM